MAKNALNEQTTHREQVLKRIRTALLQPSEPADKVTDFETNLFAYDDVDPVLAFVKRFTSLGGKFVFCSNRHEYAALMKEFIHNRGFQRFYAVEPWLCKMMADYQIPFERNEDLAEAEAVVTGCESLIAMTGSIMVSSRQTMGRTSTAIPHIHVVVGFTHQIVNELKDGFFAIQKKYDGDFPSMISTITGPSRTADIEKTLVLGAHGPKEIVLFLIEE